MLKIINYKQHTFYYCPETFTLDLHVVVYLKDLCDDDNRYTFALLSNLFRVAKSFYDVANQCVNCISFEAECGGRGQGRREGGYKTRFFVKTHYQNIFQGVVT